MYYLWLVSLALIYIICLLWIPRIKDVDRRGAIVIASFLSFVLLSSFLIEYPAEKRTRQEYYGTPIVSRLQNFEGKYFNPLAFFVMKDRILMYNEDNRVYALDGLELENGLTSTNLVAGIMDIYVVYRKDGKLIFGRR